MQMKPSQVNKKLIWDFDWDESEYDTGEFERWYVRRVLTRGMKADIIRVGIETIRLYWESLRLPEHIRYFWKWYFSKGAA